MAMSDKRVHKRVRFQSAIEIYDMLNDKFILGRIVDISAGRIAILTNDEVPVDTPISITFEIETIKYTKVPADVVRCRDKSGMYDVGIKFFNLSPAQVEDFDRTVRRLFSRLERGMQRGKLI